MRTPFSATALLAAAPLVASALGGCAETRAPISAAPGAVAVVELFTSEGCSSCPPAEDLLNTLHEDALSGEGPPVIALAFHVDYWDRLGWSDRFASPDYSQRQGIYTQTLPGGRLTRGRAYTPQMVVNGTSGFVGSAQGKAHEALTQSLAAPAAVAVDLHAVRRGDTLEFAWTLTHDAAISGSAQINLALTEDNLTSDVDQGENRGRTLVHHAVVRGWHSAPATTSGSYVMDLPPDAAPGQIAAVAYVQASPGGPILGAARATPGP